MRGAKTACFSFKVGFDCRTHFTRGSLLPSNRTLGDLAAEGGSPARALFIVEKSLLGPFPELPGSIESYCETRKEAISTAAAPLCVEGGEQSKRMDFVLDLCESMRKARLCRKSFAVIIGGGALLDSAGLAAALVHRGVRQIRMPTTVLSQCDSGVGVKNAVNFSGQKNFLGAFAPPYAVIDDFDFLKGLPQREIAAGAAEALKVSLIKDAAFFEWLCERAAKIAKGSMADIEEMVERCARIHIEHIANSGDPFEMGNARPLDFGHWAAHKLEMLSEGRIRHGEAVAIGLLIDTRYAVLKGLVSQSVLERLLKAVKDFGLQPSTSLLDKRSSSGRRLVMDGIEEFREHLGGELYITLPSGLGSKIEVNSLDLDLVEKSIRELSAK